MWPSLKGGMRTIVADFFNYDTKMRNNFSRKFLIEIFGDIRNTL